MASGQWAIVKMMNAEVIFTVKLLFIWFLFHCFVGRRKKSGDH